MITEIPSLFNSSNQTVTARANATPSAGPPRAALKTNATVSLATTASPIAQPKNTSKSTYATPSFTNDSPLMMVFNFSSQAFASMMATTETGSVAERMPPSNHELDQDHEYGRT